VLKKNMFIFMSVSEFLLETFFCRLPTPQLSMKHGSQTPIGEGYM
jgi:hypothetical protein